MSRFRFINVERAASPLRTLCRVLERSRAGDSAWTKREVSLHAHADAALCARIRTIHRKSRCTYGTTRVHAEAADAHGVRCGRDRVARLMREAGLVACADAGGSTHQLGSVRHRRREPRATLVGSRGSQQVVGRRYHRCSDRRRVPLPLRGQLLGHSGMRAQRSLPLAHQASSSPGRLRVHRDLR